MGVAVLQRYPEKNTETNYSLSSPLLVLRAWRGGWAYIEQNILPKKQARPWSCAPWKSTTAL